MLIDSVLHNEMHGRINYHRNLEAYGIFSGFSKEFDNFAHFKSSVDDSQTMNLLVEASIIPVT